MYTGLTGALKIVSSFGVSTKIAYISGFSIEDKTELIEANKIGNIYKSYAAGFQNWSASAEGTVAFETTGGHEALFLAKHHGQKIKLQFFLNDKSISGAGADDTFFSGEGYIESLSVSLSAEDKGTVSISVAGSGPLDLFVNGENIKTGKKQEDIYFKIDENNHLILVTDEHSSLWFRVDDDGHLKVSLAGEK